MDYAHKSMRILLVNKYHYLRGGAERAYLDMAEILTAAGHEVAFFSMEHPKNLPTVWDKYFVSGVEYGDDAHLGLLDKIRAVLRLWWNKEAQTKLSALIRDFRPDIAHLHNIYHQISPSILWTLKKHNIPMVMTLHDYKLICPNYSLFAHGHVWEKSKQFKYYACVLDKCVKDSYLKSFICTFEAYLHRILGSFRKIDIFVSPSHFLMSKFREFGFKGDVRYIPQPIIDTWEDARQMISSEDSSRINNAPFVFFGRLSGEKGIDVAIRAMTHYKGNSLLHIIGSGPEEELLKHLAKEIGVEDRVMFLGPKYGEELNNALHKAKAIILPSVWYENMPYVLTESFALGKIVVASRMGGMTERINDGENGFLFASGDEKDLALKMLAADLLSDKERKRIEECAKQSNVLFSRGKYLENLESLYSQLIALKRID